MFQANYRDVEQSYPQNFSIKIKYEYFLRKKL